MHPSHPPSSNSRLRPITLAVLSALSLAPVLAQASNPAPGAALDASEFLISPDFNTAYFSIPRVAEDAAGDFVIVWTDYTGTATGYDVYAQRYNAAGDPEGSAFRVNTETSGAQGGAHVAMDATGDFVVTWGDFNGGVNNIYARLYSADGTPQGSAFQANTFTSDNQYYPAVAMDAAGDFVVAWISQDPSATAYIQYQNIYARRYDKNGIAQESSEFVVDTATVRPDGTSPNVAMDVAGDFVVTWQCYSIPVSSGSGYENVYARRYDSAGSAQGSTFVVNSSSSTGGYHPSVALDAKGDFVILWETPLSGGKLYARRYAANGSARDTTEIQVNTLTGVDQAPAVAMDAVGDFVATWVGYYYNVYARQFMADGTPVSVSDTQINTQASQNHVSADVAVDAAGDFVIAFTDDGNYITPPYQLYARRFARASSLDIKSTLTVSPADSVQPGGSVTLTAGVDNEAVASTATGNATIDTAFTTASGITATLTLPSGVQFKSATGTNWSCPSTPVSNQLVCTYSMPLTAATVSDQLTVVVTAPSTVSTLDFSNVASGDQPDGNTSNNTATVSVTVSGSGSSSSSSSSSGGGGALGLLSLLGLGLLGFGRRRNAS